MQVNQPSNKTPEDQDIDFDMNETSTTATAGKSGDTGSGSEKEASLNSNAFKPLSEEEKQPKIENEQQLGERIKEVNRRDTNND